MAGCIRRLTFFAAIGTAACVQGAAYACQTAEKIPDAAANSGAGYDEISPFNRFEAAALAHPSADVEVFLQYVQETYLPNERLGIFHLRSAEMAKLFGYAIGEATANPAPIDVFSPRFMAELENWIVRVSVYGEMPLPGGGPAAANQMWRLVQESARGFYDDEMRAAYGSVTDDVGTASVEEWFRGLSLSEKQNFLQRAAKAGLSRETGAPYSIAEFEALSILMDGDFERQGYSMETRRKLVADLAAGRFVNSSEE